MSLALWVLKCKIYNFAAIRRTYNQIEGVLPLPQAKGCTSCGKYFLRLFGLVLFGKHLVAFRRASQC